MRNRVLAESLNVQATPTFVVGKELVPGAVTLARLEALVAKAQAADGNGESRPVRNAQVTQPK